MRVKRLPPDNKYDQELASFGIKRGYKQDIVPVLTNKLDEEGNPIYTFGSVHRQIFISLDGKSEITKEQLDKIKALNDGSKNFKPV